MSRIDESESIEGFLQRVQPQLRAMLARYSIPPRDAEALLRDVFLTLVYKHESIASPERWLLRNLRQSCLLFWKHRKWQLYSRLDAALLQALHESVGGPKGRGLVAQELENVLATLPADCQRALRERYGLLGKMSLAGEGQEQMVGDRAQAFPTLAPPRELAACLATLSKRLVEFGLLDDDISAVVH